MLSLVTLEEAAGEVLGRRVRQGDKTLTEAELNTFLEQMLDFHVREAELERTYYLRCRSTLPADKLVRLPMVCKDFARRFFERHRAKRLSSSSFSTGISASTSPAVRESSRIR